MREPLQLSIRLFRLFNENNIVYCHWKSNEHLYEGLIGETDLDVLILYEMKDAAEKCLNSLGYSKFVSQFGARYNYVDDWIGCDEETGKLIHIHLHYKMITGHKGMKEFDLPWTEYALETRVLHNEFSIFVTEPCLELIILTSRIVLKSSYSVDIRAIAGRYLISDSDKVEREYLISLSDRKNVEAIADRFFGEDGTRLTELIFQNDVGSQWFQSVSKIVKRHLKKYDRFMFFGGLARIYYCLALKLRKLVKINSNFDIITKKTPTSGLMVAFLGQDGAGKSTVSNDVVNWLTWKLDAKKFYLGSGEHYKSWQKTLRAKVNGNSAIQKAIKNYLTISDFNNISKVTYKKIKRAVKYTQKGGIAVFDRYPQMQFVGINDGPKIRARMRDNKLSPWLNKVVLHYALKEEESIRKAVTTQPDLVFKLILPPEESIRRKPGEDFENIEMKHDIINKLTFPNSEVITVRADQEYNDEIVLIRNTIWRSLVKNTNNSHLE